MRPASTSLISPQSQTRDEDVAALEESVSATESDTAASDLQAERDERMAEVRARRDAKRSKQRTRLDTKRTNQQTRKDDQQARRRAAASTPTPTPTRSSSVATAQAVELAVFCPHDGRPQTMTITNRGTSTISVTKMSSLFNPVRNLEPFLATDVTIAPNATQQIQFGGIGGEIPNAYWITNQLIFDNSPLEGGRLELQSGQVFFACCDGTRTCLGESATQVEPAPTPSAVPARRKKNRDKKRARRKQTVQA